MSTPRGNGRPGRSVLFGMMLVNALAAAVLLTIVSALFGVDIIIIDALAGLRARGWLSDEETSVVPLMIPGAAIAFGCLWHWLVMTARRTRYLPWFGAAIYGVLIAYANVPMTGLLFGLLRGNPLIGLLLALLSLLWLPSLMVSMAVFGTLMGLLNAWMARKWLDRR